MTVSVQVIQYILGWIDDNLHQPLRIDDIVRRAGYSRRHLQRLFLQCTGVSLGRYIRERRLLLATCDLRDSPLTVGDIVHKYGYDSLPGFYRVFTHKYRLPPGAWRKAQAGPREPACSQPVVASAAESGNRTVTENTDETPVS